MSCSAIKLEGKKAIRATPQEQEIKQALEKLAISVDGYVEVQQVSKSNDKKAKTSKNKKGNNQEVVVTLQSDDTDYAKKDARVAYLILKKKLEQADIKTENPLENQKCDNPPEAIQFRGKFPEILKAIRGEAVDRGSL